MARPWSKEEGTTCNEPNHKRPLGPRWVNSPVDDDGTADYKRPRRAQPCTKGISSAQPNLKRHSGPCLVRVQDERPQAIAKGVLSALRAFELDAKLCWATCKASRQSQCKSASYHTARRESAGACCTGLIENTIPPRARCSGNSQQQFASQQSNL